METRHNRPPIIASHDHPHIRQILRLQSRIHRDNLKLASIEGVRFVLSAERAGALFMQVLISPRLLISSAARRAVQRLEASGTQVVQVTPELFRRFSTAKRASGVAAIVRQRYRRLDELDRIDAAASPRLWLGIRRIDSPGNLGTICRTACAVGAAGIMFFGNVTDPFDLAVIRASMGAMFHLPLVRTTHRALHDWKQQHPHWSIVGAAAEGSRVLYDADFTRDTILLLGNERKGLTPEEFELCDQTTRIPMMNCASVTSLNVAVAASVFMYEAWRQNAAHQSTPAAAS